MASLSAERHEHGSSVIDYEFLAPANTNLSKFNLDELLAGMNEATAKFAIPLDNDGKLRCVYNHCQRRFDVTSDAVKEAAGIVVRCRTCADEQLLKGRLGFSGIVVPRKCLRARQGQGDDCGLDPYLIVADKSDYVDQQTLKLQESPEDVPTGEMPRQVLL